MTITPITRPAIVAIALSGDVLLRLSATDETYCVVGVHMQTVDGETVITEHVGLTPEEAAAWGEDDSVLLEIVATKRGWM
jgi:hypothetical protein